MRILTALTYYRPHYSGLTIYAERLARALAKRGHRITVLTSRYDRQLPTRETTNGMDIIRLDVGVRISKGVIMPLMPYWATRLVEQADMIHLHVPQLDAALIASISRLYNKPVVLTYHCDLHLPVGFVHSIANQASHLANHIAARASNVIVTNTMDYAENSPFLRRYLDKIRIVPPPVELPSIEESELTKFRKSANIQPGQRIIGMAARLATEKGVEYLVQALPEVLEQHPTARVLFVGQYQDVLGEDAYARKLDPLITQLGDHWTFLGVLSPKEFTAFFHVAEVTVLPSINSTESFGMVQVEAMTCGTPVVATDIPGVRQPVKLTGMGRVVPMSDANSLAEAIISILDEPAAFTGDVDAITQRFAPDTIAAEYELIFKELVDP
jgi:glycosyltransferase involved in cell wall biosynthesis